MKNLPATTKQPLGDSKPSSRADETSASSCAGQRTGSSGRDRFATDELAIVMSHFDIGTIESVKEFPRGSRRAPKLLIRSTSGSYLLKRRAAGKNDPFKVAFCHHLQLSLASKQFPLPHLIGTRQENNSILQLNSHIYELFEFINGTTFDNSAEATADAGKTLALFHKLLKDFKPQYDPPKGSYHAARAVTRSLETIPKTLSKVDSQNATDQTDRIQQTLQFLQASYNAAALQSNEMSLGDWPAQVVHSDWHPGNMLFRGPRVVAVIDYDAARIQQRAIDLANGALQFSIIGGSDNPETWPDHLDEDRYKNFVLAYDAVPKCVVTRAELKVIPWLMIEALIAETAIPIAATGSFACMDGVEFLMMVERKVRWLQEHAQDLASILDD